MMACYALRVAAIAVSVFALVAWATFFGWLSGHAGLLNCVTATLNAVTFWLLSIVAKNLAELRGR